MAVAVGASLCDQCEIETQGANLVESLVRLVLVVIHGGRIKTDNVRVPPIFGNDRAERRCECRVRRRTRRDARAFRETALDHGRRERPTGVAPPATDSLALHLSTDIETSPNDCISTLYARHSILEMPQFYAVRTAAAFSRPSSSVAVSRILYFWILPVTVIGKASVNFQ